MQKLEKKEEQRSVENSSYCCGGGNSTSEEFDEEVEQSEGTDEVSYRATIRKQYGSVAASSSVDPENYSKAGYSKEELDSIPKGANLGLGTGNPVALAEVQPGEVVVDLGSGAGVDVFLAAQKVGPTGKAIGIDMTPKMIDKARYNAIKGNYTNVEFRLGEIEHLPLEDNSVDVIVSNCVINLSVNKDQVFREINRVLKPGGRIVVSDIVLSKDMPMQVKEILSSGTSCAARALTNEEYVGGLEKAGLSNTGIIDFDYISPSRKPKTLDNGNKKRKIILNGKEHELELSPEEDNKLLTSMMKAHIKAVKPFN